MLIFLVFHPYLLARWMKTNDLVLRNNKTRWELFLIWIASLFPQILLKAVSAQGRIAGTATAASIRWQQGCSFAKQVEGAEPVKTTQSTITILEFPISPRIWHFLRSSCLGSDPSCGGSSPHNWIRNYTPGWQSYLYLISDIFRYVFDTSCSELSNAAFSVPLWSLVQEIIFGENGCLTLCPMAIVNFACCPFCSTASCIFRFSNRKSAWAKHGQAVVAEPMRNRLSFPSIYSHPW